jgi:hypothetical protein
VVPPLRPLGYSRLLDAGVDCNRPLQAPGRLALEVPEANEQKNRCHPILITILDKSVLFCSDNAKTRVFQCQAFASRRNEQKGTGPDPQQNILKIQERVMRLRVRPTFLLIGFGLLLLLPKESAAVPQFSRRYNIKCSACHTIAPVLNEQGWMFKPRDSDISQ